MPGIGSIYAYTRELDAWFESRLEEGAREHARQRPIGQAQLSGFRHPPWVAGAGGCLRARRPDGTRRGSCELLERAWERGVGRTATGRLSSPESPAVRPPTRPGIRADGLPVRATVLVGRCNREALVAYAPWIAILQWMIRTTAARDTPAASGRD